jgi:hypothetical protein
MKKQTYIIHSGNINTLLEEFKENEKDFTLKRTGYTVTLDSKRVKYLITTSLGGNELFKAANKIKKDVKNSNFIIDIAPKNTIFYYSVYKSLQAGTTIYDKVYNIDITSAYATVLLNNNVITQETYNYLRTISKANRLKAVGMLATQTAVYEFINGKAINFKIKTIPDQRNIFLFCCYEIGRIMEEISLAIGKDFIFYWVDGIYFKDEKNTEIIENILNNYNYKHTFEQLNNFEIINKTNYIDINFDRKEKRKQFCVPKNDHDQINKLINKLNNDIKFN